MNRSGVATACNRCQILIQTIGIERSDRSHKACYGLKTGIECLVCRQLVGAHIRAPETLAAETNEPVAHVVDNELLNETTGLCWLIVVEACVHVLHKSIEFRDDPTVKLRTLAQWNLWLFECKAVDICIHCKEAVCLVKLAEERTDYLLHTLLVEAEVIPRSRVCNHVPTECVATVVLDCIEWVYRIAKTLRHLVTVLVKYETVRDYCLEGNGIEYHRRNSVECVEPSACLVNTLGNEVRRIHSTAVKQLLVLEWIVDLCIWHCTGVEPNVNEVELTCHNLACWRYKLDVIHIWTVQVNLVVVLLAVVTWNKALILVWVA